MTGKAAHIHAAAPGGPRYLASMTPGERRDISNAIWLCSHHAELIDDDEATYTGSELREMKREHEAQCAKNHRDGLKGMPASSDLIALGPDIVFCGELIEANQAEWCFRLHHFVEGDLHALLALVSDYERTATNDRYVLVNSLGNGRILRGSPTLQKALRYEIKCPVEPDAERIGAADLPTDFAISEEGHDLFLNVDGHIAEVSGVDALQQSIKTCLSSQRGESPFHRDFGTRFSEYFRLLSGSVWFEQLLKLEVIRQAAVPYSDPIDSRRYTPLQCVERVFAIELLADAPINDWLPIRLDLDIKGLGRWKRDLTIFVPKEVMRRPSLEEMMSGPFLQIDP
ncbi:hypothetical protein ACVIIW_003942 [Bradyrhizobium sp. USDA 4449]